MNHHVCWITDYFAEECWERACVHSPNLIHPCLVRNERTDQEDSDVS